VCCGAVDAPHATGQNGRLLVPGRPANKAMGMHVPCFMLIAEDLMLCTLVGACSVLRMQLPLGASMQGQPASLLVAGHPMIAAAATCLLL
jgi:hypothetical protein